MLRGAQNTMPLKSKYQAKDEIPAAHLPFYPEREGAFVLEAEGLVDKARLDESRASNLALQKQVQELTERFEGIDPDAVRALQAEKAALEDAKLIKDGEVEKLVEKRTKPLLTDLEKRLKAAEAQAATLSTQLFEREIERNVVETASKLGLRASAIPDIKARARSVFKITDGAVAAFEPDGRPVFGADGTSPLTFDEWVSAQVTAAPHLFESNAGSGASGHASGGGGIRTGRNPFKAGPDWNLTEQMKLSKTDPTLALRLKASA